MSLKGAIIAPMVETTQHGRIDPHFDIESWRPGPSAPSLADDSVHIWSVPLVFPDDHVADLAALLSVDERERAQRFRFDRHRRRFIAARSSLRLILGRYTGDDPRRLIFGLGPYGKPFLAENTNAPGLEFNVTHSGELALIAIALNRQVGVDVEQMQTLADAEMIAKQFFSSDEYASLMTLEDGQRQRGFFNCWTRKEAFIKAIGEGLTFPLDSFQVSLDDYEPAQLLWLKGVPDPAERWSLHAFEPDEGYVAALACEGMPKRIAGYRFQQPDS